MKVYFVLFFPLVIGFILGCCTSVLCCLTHWHLSLNTGRRQSLILFGESAYCVVETVICVVH